MPNTARGYADSEDRVPPGWKVVQLDRWPINNNGAGMISTSPDKDWRFETSGSVDEPLSLTYDEFLKLPTVTKCLDHHCIDGWSYLGQTWNGVEFQVIKQRTKVKEDDARFVLIEGDGASQTFPIDQNLFFAFGQDGSPLTRAAGFPLRVVVPGEFGNKSIKWVRKVRFSKTPLVDSRIQLYKDLGIYDYYVQNIAGKNPWTVDINAKKEFLRQLFGHLTENRRAKKRAKLLEQSAEEQDTKRSSTPSLIRLCQVEELKENSCSKFEKLGNEILLIRSNDNIYAIEPMCTHQGTDLCKGRLNPTGKTIKCPLHGAIFDLRTGACLVGSYGVDGDNFPPVRTYKVRIESGAVLVEL